MAFGLQAIDRKGLRDTVRMRAQFFAIALVLACGLGSYLGMRATMRSLEAARAHYYARQRFADVFASLKRAPEHIALRLRDLPGVQRLETRVVADVTLDVPGMVEPATGRLISIPDDRQPLINGLVLRSGRLPQLGRATEVLANEAFAKAHGFVLGREIGAVMNGAWVRLRVVGTALSPEYTYSMGAGQTFPDDRRFGVFWMRRQALAAAFDMEGAFNDVCLSTERDAIMRGVLQNVDTVLGEYGGTGAIPQKDQISAFLIESDLTQLRVFALLMPSLFFGVAAFLLNVVVGRIVAGQREQIAALKALGYRDREVAWHFAKIIGAVVAAGTLLGIGIAYFMGSWMTDLYAQYYHFPELPFVMSAVDALPACLIGVLTAAVGTWAAIGRTLRLPPAEAMRPEAPPTYRATLVERLGITRLFPPAIRMILRELERKPARAAMTVTGVAFAVGLTVMNAFTFDAVDHMLNVQFGLNQREDIHLSLVEPRATGILSELKDLPGVEHAEPFRMVPVRLRSGPRMRHASIMGIPDDAALQAIHDTQLRRIQIPSKGLVLSKKLAEILAVRLGDFVRVEVLEGQRGVHDVVVARVAETFLGLTAQMDLAALCELLGEAESLNGAWLAADERQIQELYEVVKKTPMIAGVTTRRDTLNNVQKMIDGYLGTWVGICLSFSLIMACGVLYNAARITLAERSRELASLRVLGFRRREVAWILLGELAALTVVAIPLGLVLGRSLAAVLVSSPGYDTEQFRLPLVISLSTYALAAITVVVAALISGWIVWCKLDRMNIVEVLKSRD